MGTRDIDFDHIDYQILRILHEDARIPTSSIAREVGLDVRTVNKRIKRMKDSGAIRPSLLIDPSRFGYPCIVEIYLHVDAAQFNAYSDKFVSDHRIPYVAVQWDQNQLELQARFRTNEDVYKFVNIELPSMPGLQVLSYHLVPVILKNIDSWVPNVLQSRPEQISLEMIEE